MGKKKKHYVMCYYCQDYGYSYYNDKHCPMNCDYAINIKKREREKFYEKWDEVRKRRCPFCNKKRLSLIGSSIYCMNCGKEIKEVA